MIEELANNSSSFFCSLKGMNALDNKTFFIKTYGCQMNVYDSSKIAALLEQEGMVATSSVDDADVIILNTCHIREKARHKVLTELGFLKQTKEQRHQRGEATIIAVGGCVAQAEGKEIMRSAPYVDIIFGTQNYHYLPRMLKSAFADPSSGLSTPPLIQIEDEKHHHPLIDIDFPAEDKFDQIPKRPQTEGAAFLAIQEGCDKFCSYCVVPYTRGVEVSRPVESILEEARLIAQSGGKELTLLGQNVNAYHGIAADGNHWRFAQLVRSISTIPGISRIFYTSSHPIDFEQDLIHAHAELPNLMPFIHLPVQSGSNAVLKAMNRGYTIEDYKRLIDQIKNTCPNVVFASDFIIGFPGETEEDFEDTLDLVRYVNYTQAFSFKYSRRPGTPASVMDNQISETVKEERLQRLQCLLNQQQKKFNEDCAGKVCSVMFQKYGKYPNQILGKSEYMQSVVISNVDPRSLMYTIRPVRIIRATLNSLEGELI